MPRKAAQLSEADKHAAEGGAVAVDRALFVLSAFREGDGTLGLAELAQRSGLYKSTLLRLLASLEHARLIQRHADGRYGLGPEIARLNAVYAASFSLEQVVLPALRELVRATRESAAFHIQQGEHRLCLYRVDSPQPVRDHIRAGDLLPLNRGAGGRVLRAFAGARGEIYQRIRDEGVIALVGDRSPDIAGVSSPVFGPGGELKGALTLTCPTPRFSESFREQVLDAARGLTQALGGTFPEVVEAAGPSSSAATAPQDD
ncbi:IclR family transcriptional regulator [Cupriavidus metallidurans]|uniref:IclR family transcriptional regulator n=1 Tax=Cupriavidus TaxID=106589 RepID=UPI0002A38657|nr:MULTISPECIES: IclR family transcriptional regulator [Cupriavidus]EKZ96339.1 IclR family transcriptional regulator [Cupriavidus sp. HMR-1]GMG93349.1 transcriptional regulator [Cupriavidus sp. TKC]HBO80708.1 IclR family transcriptional regulator [Cupriavidus sp.]